MKYMKCRVELGIKHMEKREENTILGTFRRLVPVQVELIPVHFAFWSFLANLYRYKLELYRYNLFWFSCFDQFSYFGHNFLISYPI